MSKHYEDIMSHLTVTEEMRERILDNLATAKSSGSAKKSSLLWIRRSLPIVACLALLLLGTWLVPRHALQDSSENQTVASVNGIEEATSLAELSEMVGFDVEGLKELPFSVEETKYTSYWGELAQISYTGEGQILIYRKSPGSDDNSGDYTSYESEISADIHSVSVQLKGSGNLFCLAIWNVDGYSYSVYSESGLSKQEFMDLLENNV